MILKTPIKDIKSATVKTPTDRLYNEIDGVDHDGNPMYAINIDAYRKFSVDYIDGEEEADEAFELAFILISATNNSTSPDEKERALTLVRARITGKYNGNRKDEYELYMKAYVSFMMSNRYSKERIEKCGVLLQRLDELSNNDDNDEQLYNIQTYRGLCENLKYYYEQSKKSNSFVHLFRPQIHKYDDIDHNGRVKILDELLSQCRNTYDILYEEGYSVSPMVVVYLTLLSKTAEALMDQPESCWPRRDRSNDRNRWIDGAVNGWNYEFLHP